MEKMGLIEREGKALFLKPLLSTTALLITFQGEKEAFTLAINEKGEMEKYSPVEKAHSRVLSFTKKGESSKKNTLFTPFPTYMIRLNKILWIKGGFDIFLGK
ncbi:hypothetical protein DT075_11545 [Bacillus licheniformis]|nr:hypothetical protein DT075_11545 [Bacillus licheniformis]